MKRLILAASLVFCAQAMANAECAGRAADGSFVKIEITTIDPKGLPSEGEVSFESGGNTYGYKFAGGDVAQFFEYDEPSNNSAVVGLSAFVNNEAPISIKYVGPNFVDMDLKVVVDAGQTKDLQGNIFRVWKGPGRASTDQVQVSNFGCSVWY